MRVAIFLRVSSDEQAGSDRVSLDAQERQCRESCERRGWEVSHVYRADESAFTDNLSKRPMMQQAITAAESHEFDVLMVHEGSRFARNTALAGQLRKRLATVNVRLSDVNDFIDAKGADGEFMATVTDGMHQWYSAKIGEHIRKARKELWMEGYHSGDVPFGYRRPVSVAKTVLQVVPEEAEAIRELFADRARGWSIEALTDRLNLSGLTPHSKLGRTRFTQSSICSLIENPFYHGMVAYHGELRPGNHRPILSRQEWLAAQPKSRPGYGDNPSRGTKALLTGIALCSVCDGKLWLGGNVRSTYSYMERSHARGGDCPNARTSWSTREPDALVERTLQSLTFDGEWMAYLNQWVKKPATSRPQRNKVREERDRLIDLYVSGAITRDEFEARVGVLDQKLGELPPDKPLVLTAVKQLRSVGELWERLPADRKSHYAKSFLQGVTMDTRNRDVVSLRPREDFAPLFDLRRRFVIVDSPPGGMGDGFTIADLGISA